MFFSFREWKVRDREKLETNITQKFRELSQQTSRTAEGDRIIEITKNRLREVAQKIGGDEFVHRLNHK